MLILESFSSFSNALRYYLQLTGSRARAVESLEGFDLVETVELAVGGGHSGCQKIQVISANTRWTRGVALGGVNLRIHQASEHRIDKGPEMVK